MALKIRRGTEAQRSGVTFAAGEIVWTTNGHKLYVGDGVTPGGIDVAAQLGGVGVAYNQTTGKLDLNLGAANTDTLLEGSNHLYFTANRAVAAAGNSLVAGNGFNTGITFSYDDVNHRITAVVTGGGGTTLPSQTGNAGKFLSTDGAGTLNWSAVATSVNGDPSPMLGGNLNLNSHNITGTGNINITGFVTASGAITSSGSIAGPNVTITTNTITSSLGYLGLDRSDNPLVVGSAVTPNTLWINSARNFGMYSGITDGTNTSGLTIKMARGTLASPLTTNAGDPIVFIEGMAHNGTAYSNVGAFGTFTSQTWNGTPGTGGQIPGSFGAIVLDIAGASHIMEFNDKGVLSAPVFKAGSYPTGSLPSNPEAGWIVFDSTTSQFKGWNGTIWAVLG